MSQMLQSLALLLVWMVASGFSLVSESGRDRGWGGFRNIEFLDFGVSE